MAKKSLVIVESPTKARIITKFLDSTFKVSSSGGHLIDLPKSEMGVDVENGFEPKYVVIGKKKKMLSDLRKDAKDKTDIYIASDPDREGEAIGWHITQRIGEGKKIHRVVFHEITKDAIKKAFEHVTDIDLKKVKAQQARRILDRIVGYSISPLLWKRVGRGLSAGRVQSVAVRLIVEREQEIKAFVSQEYWQIEAQLEKVHSPQSIVHSQFSAMLDKIDDKKAEVGNEKEAKELVSQIENQEFIVKDIKVTQKKRNPTAAFTTSKLQQEAFNKLRFPAEKTMRIAQQLYEGIELGKEEGVGLITYMRTDSVNVSKTALEEVRDFIKKEFGGEYLPETANFYKSKKGAQEAHEAIRPTSVKRNPDAIKKHLTDEQYKLYKLIWDKFVSSQMKPALYSLTNVEIAAGARFLFKAGGSRLLFKGFLAVYSENNEEGKNLPELKVNEKLKLRQLMPTQHFTQPPPRYSDASLVKVLEENGVGRPSTYAPIIQTIIFRGYVMRKEGYFYPTELGTVVNELLIRHFPKVMDIEFTAFMEEELDQIEEGKINEIDVLRTFYEPFSKNVAAAVKNMENVKKQLVETGEKCPECGHALVIRMGRRGRFISCSGFPKCKFTKSISTDVACPQQGCGGKLVERRSKKGAMFYGCTNYPQCTYVTKKLPKEENNNNG